MPYCDTRKTRVHATSIAAVDVFCGVGGLSYGLLKAGIHIVAGFDLDPRCKYAFESNVGAPFVLKDVRRLTGATLSKLYPPRSLRLLAGCAPCQPFSPFTRGIDTSRTTEWSLLEEFGRLAVELRPHLITMENVPDLASRPPFVSFVDLLEGFGYCVIYKSVFCPEFGVPQYRRRLVLIASRISEPLLPVGNYDRRRYRTVRDAIASLPSLRAGEVNSRDPLHWARSLTNINLERIKHSRPGGTWRDWPHELRAPCHRRSSGASYQSVYARMKWDEPSPTITTQSYNFGTGRFGHPEQHRSITLREAALLQSFPRTYRFVRRGEKVEMAPVGRLIGNAVPPLLGKAIGKAIIASAKRRVRSR